MLRARYGVCIVARTRAGLTWTGQRRARRSTHSSLLSVLAPFAASGIPIVGVEPSCTGCTARRPARRCRDPALGIVVGHDAAPRFCRSCPSRRLPGGASRSSRSRRTTARIMGWDTDQALLESLGALEGTRRYRHGGGPLRLVSHPVASHYAAPTLDAQPDLVYLADGFSCHCPRQPAHSAGASPGDAARGNRGGYRGVKYAIARLLIATASNCFTCALSPSSVALFRRGIAPGRRHCYYCISATLSALVHRYGAQQLQ